MNLPLRLFLQPQEERPILGRFDKSVKELLNELISNTTESSGNLEMFAADESVKNEDRHFYGRRKRLKRMKFNPREEMVLQRSQEPRRLYVGKRLDMTLQDTTSVSTCVDMDTMMENPYAQKKAEDSFRYVLLQRVVKDPTSTSPKAEELNVIPVGHWFKFAKPSAVAEKFLDAVHDDFEISVAERKKALNKHRSIMSRMLKDGDSDDEGRRAADDEASDFFGKGALQKNKKKLGSLFLDDTKAGKGGGEEAELRLTRADDEDGDGGEQGVLEQLEDEHAEQLVSSAYADAVDGDDDEEEEEERTNSASGDAAMQVNTSAREIFLHREKGLESSSSLGSLASLASAGDSSGLDYELSDEGVRAFITAMGGMVTVDVLKSSFRAPMKAFAIAHGGDKKAAAVRLKDVILRVTENHRDHLQGLLLKLKS